MFPPFFHKSNARCNILFRETNDRHAPLLFCTSEDENLLARKLYDFSLINLLCTIGPRERKRETYSRRKGHFEIFEWKWKITEIIAHYYGKYTTEMSLRDVLLVSRVSTLYRSPLTLIIVKNVQEDNTPEA